MVEGSDVEEWPSDESEDWDYVPAVSEVDEKGFKFVKPEIMN